jgi:acyl carrier protein
VLPGAAFALEDEEGERLVVVHQLDRQYREADHHQIVTAIRRSIVEQHELDPYAIVLIRQTSLPITSSGKVQRNLCREQYIDGKLKVVHAWTNPAMQSVAKAASSGRAQVHSEGVSWGHNGDSAGRVGAPPSRGGLESLSSVPLGLRQRCAAPASVELDRAAERIEAWLLEWLVARLALEPADVSRDRPFAEFGVDSLTAVELSHELEEQFKVPLPPIVAWNYPTPAALARYLAEQTTGIAGPQQSPTMEKPTGRGELAATPDESQLAALVAEVESLSDAEAARLLADEQPQA